MAKTTKFQRERKRREEALRNARLNPVTTLRPEREAFRALAAQRRKPTGDRVPSHSIMRGACHGTEQIDGRDLAENLATGKLRMAWKDKDAAGPLRENVGLTVTSLDYRRTRDHGTFEKNPHPAHVAGSNAAKIAAYVTRDGRTA